ncbi:hypothetical protein ARMSODRAFT_974520 [Armillaria solidipes]|uniref:Heterokaryon incompatibility domain-containing protein n=1 Tax=Armillaria solidipes TaxID=1076256 RepID=A0A2H3BVD3_9AGAR|nr:hypothetical protein ARMSODRAFT_974520 [Armillaria solidipes]
MSVSFSPSKSRYSNNIVSSEITITSFTETGQAESSIKVPLQRSYTGRIPIIPSSLADTSCATLGIPGLLDLFNTTLGTSRTLNIPSLSSVLENCIKNNHDFGTAYGRLRAVLSTAKYGTIRNILRKREADDRKMRQKALVGGRIVQPYLQPRRVWDLCANRVVPWWNSGAFLRCFQLESSMPMIRTESNVRPISHAWMDANGRVDVQTPINGYEWPVPIPKDVNLDLIRIELLNLGVEYTWLDVLCLRQKDGMREDLREEEWKLDVPTIGAVYGGNKVVIYLNGLGRPLALKEGDLENDRSWFRRAWTLQEVGKRRFIAGDMPDGPLHTRPIEPGVKQSCGQSCGIGITSAVHEIPAYHESESLEDAWTALVDVMSVGNRGELFFWYPEPGDAHHKWRPSWDQIMSKALPANEISNMDVDRDDETDNDWYEGPCVGKGFVRGLTVRGGEKVDRCGELMVKDADGIEHIFNIIAHHGHPIPEDTYTLLGMESIDSVAAPNPLHYYPPVRTQYWVIGRRLSDEKFEKVSVFEMADRAEVRRLSALGITENRRNILI